MGSIGQNLQLQSDGSEMVCAIRHQYVMFCELWEKISVPEIKNIGFTWAQVDY